MWILDWRIGLAVAALAVGVVVVASANPDAGACRQACLEAHGECVSFCADHDDPIHCDAECRERMIECEERCE